MKTEKEKMLAGEVYDCADNELLTRWHKAKQLQQEYNNTLTTDAGKISDLLDELITQSVQHIGKPVTLMSKEDKVQVVRLLNEAGAFLITKSGPKVCQFLGISKYTLYSYLDEIKSKNTI